MGFCSSKETQVTIIDSSYRTLGRSGTTYKLVVIGESGVGKSSLLVRYTSKTFSSKFVSTVGVEFHEKELLLNEQLVKLQIWDTGGQERFRTITNNYYRGSHGIVIVYDITNKESFDNLSTWISQPQYANTDATRLLVGNKLDLESLRQVPTDLAEEWAKNNGMHFCEASAKDASNVEQAFLTLAQLIHEKATNGQFKFSRS
eukprot:TRINITY_DN1434_c0_g1_i1.p1 TRINITY_DN1434_c0_g1~~TRINITY_DN1434_c0_g1_i1.p1  ORF type:complete len:202 (-),score=30.01 TRINITY_DN1434_c0_g1_i1:34-639(-)